MTIRFELNGKQHVARFNHTTMCSIEEVTGHDASGQEETSILGYGKSKCHDLDHFDKELGERKALHQVLTEILALNAGRREREGIYDLYEAALARRLKREQKPKPKDTEVLKLRSLCLEAAPYVTSPTMHRRLVQASEGK